MAAKKTAVITYIFGEYESLKEIKFINRNFEYICVTDSSTKLSSNTWNIVVDKSLDSLKSNRDKMVMVKYNPFKYSNADVLIVMDGSIQIVGSLSKISNEASMHDIGLRVHHLRNNLDDELCAWRDSRGMSECQIDKFKSIMKDSGYDIKNKGLFETCIIIYKNTKLCREICSKEIALMREIGNADGGDGMCMTNQCPFTFLMNRYYNNIDVFCFSWFDSLLRFNHKKTVPLILKQKCQPYLFNKPI